MRVNQTERLRRSREFEANQSRVRANQIETMIAQFDRICADLGQQIDAEETRARISDPTHFAYPTYAKAGRARWLCSEEPRSEAKQKPKKYHLVTSETLYALGIELTDRAITNGNTAKKVSMADAFYYRDGLLIALLALIPLRLRTLAALHIGKHLVKSGDLWVLDIPAEDIKTKRPLDYPISAELSGRIDLYLKQFRCQIPGAAMHGYLWASSQSRPMHHGSIYNTIRRRTRNALGFPVNPHRFRHAAATFWSSRDPANVRGVKDLLGHASFDTTEKHYIMAQSRLAGRALARAIGGKREGTAVYHRRSRSG